MWNVAIFPDLMCVIGARDVLDELNKSIASGASIVLHYDTTFNPGDFFLSP